MERGGGKQSWEKEAWFYRKECFSSVLTFSHGSSIFPGLLAFNRSAHRVVVERGGGHALVPPTHRERLLCARYQVQRALSWT